MNKKAILFLVLLGTTSGFTSNANANGSLIIEPGIGYKEESLKLTDLSQDLTKTTMKGPVGSLKLGFLSAAGVSLLLAGEQFTGKAEVEGNATDKPKFTHTVAGFQVGVSAMNAMKIYLGYSPLNKLKFEEAGTLPEMTLSGHTYTAGLMFFPFRYLGLGAQYNIHQFKEVEGPQFSNGKDVDLYFDKIDSTDLSFTLSIML